VLPDGKKMLPVGGVMDSHV